MPQKIRKERTLGNYNLRYLAYAASQGREPADQIEYDRDEWPGGSMTGFILWCRERLPEFSKSNQEPGFFIKGQLTEDGHRAYDVWLADYAQSHGAGK